MLNWSVIAPVLIETFSALAATPIDGVPAFQAQWRDRAREFISPDYRFALFLKVTNVATIGNDETRYEEDEDGNQVVSQNGFRRLILQVRVECVEDTDDLFAVGILERLRTRLFRPSVCDRLRDECNASIVDVRPTIDASATVDSHTDSAAVMDVVMNLAVSEDDPAPPGWIERVVFTSEINPRTNITNESVPPA